MELAYFPDCSIHERRQFAGVRNKKSKCKVNVGIKTSRC